MVALALIGFAVAAFAAPANMGFVGGKSGSGSDFQTTAP